MAKKSLVQVEGARRLRATLKQAGDDLTQLKDIHNQVARTVAQAARTPTRTGRLAQTVRAGSSKTAAIVKAGSTIKGKTPYGSVIHWGWKARHITAQPWLTQAARSTEPTWTEKYLSEVQKIIDQIEGA